MILSPLIQLKANVCAGPVAAATGLSILSLAGLLLLGHIAAERGVGSGSGPAKISVKQKKHMIFFQYCLLFMLRQPSPCQIWCFIMQCIFTAAGGRRRGGAGGERERINPAL